MKKINFPGLVGEMARRGETNEMLANLLGVRRETISKKMSGKTEWTIGEIDKICEHYGKDYYQLFKDEK